MPHLEEIHLVNVRVTDAPDLSGVTTMTKIYARDCDLGDLNWIAQSGIREAHLRCDADYSPLGNCQKLQVAQLELAPGRTADFSASPLRICWTLVWMQRETGTLPTCPALPAARGLNTLIYPE